MNPNTSLSRVLTALGHQEPDKVPLFLLLTMHGARELGMSVQEYFSNGEYVAEGQLRLQAKYDNDCYYTFFYAPIEVEAAGASVLFRDETPPNTGMPILKTVEDIRRFEPARVEESEVLQKVLKTTATLKAKAGDSIPIIGVVMSPFSIPVMQMGYDKYFLLMMREPESFQLLMEKNIRFCVDWANAQLKAGATAICYFDPVSSSSMVTPSQYLEKGYRIACETLAQINGPTATHFASGKSIPIIDRVAETGTAVLGVSCKEDIGELKHLAKNKISLLGNLNGIEMINWTEQEAEFQVKEIIRKAGKGGGLIISDNHGEIPMQVPEKVLLAIRRAVDQWGKYPLDWI